jgi:hypothetical protein
MWYIVIKYKNPELQIKKRVALPLKWVSLFSVPPMIQNARQRLFLCTPGDAVYSSCAVKLCLLYKAYFYAPLVMQFTGGVQ